MRPTNDCGVSRALAAGDTGCSYMRCCTCARNSVKVREAYCRDCKDTCDRRIAGRAKRR